MHGCRFLTSQPDKTKQNSDDGDDPDTDPPTFEAKSNKPKKSSAEISKPVTHPSIERCSSRTLASESEPSSDSSADEDEANLTRAGKKTQKTSDNSSRSDSPSSMEGVEVHRTNQSAKEDTEERSVPPSSITPSGPSLASGVHSDSDSDSDSDSAPISGSNKKSAMEWHKQSKRLQKIQDPPMASRYIAKAQSIPGANHLSNLTTLIPAMTRL